MKRWSEFRLSNLLGHVLVQNALSLYGVQVASYIVPLITIPYLARVLGAAGWGLVAFAQAFGAYVTLVSEYGFVLSATREIARNRNDHEKLAHVVSGVLGAKTLLTAASLAVAFAVGWWVPIFRDHPLLLIAGMYLAVARAFSMMWFFQGIEQMKVVAALDISAKALATVGIFVFVHHAGQEWLVLAIQGSGFFLSAMVCLALAYRELPFCLPTWSSVREALQMGWSMFLFKGSVSLYTVGNAFILGLFVAPQYVGYYAGAEKISKAFLGLLNPVNQTLYPRLSYLVQHARERAARLARIGVAVMGIGGATLGALVFFLAPLLVRVILGPGYSPAIPVLRVLALLPPLIALSNVFGIQWMLPLGLDRAFNTIILVAGLINIGLAVTLAPHYADIGMACAVVSAETFVTGAIYLLLRWRGLDPMTYHPESAGRPV